MCLEERERKETKKKQPDFYSTQTIKIKTILNEKFEKLVKDIF